MNFTDKNDLFLEPKTTQYGSHMVMTNVNKQTRSKFVNIDTRFRDEYNYNDDSVYNITLPDRYKYNITLPERITNAKTMTIKTIEIPMTFYNISKNLGNNSFSIHNDTTNYTYMVVVPDGYYARTDLITAIQTQLNKYREIGQLGQYNNFSISIIGGNINLIANSGAYGAVNGNADVWSYTVNFATDKYNFKSSLGWVLGYRNIIYTCNSSNPGWTESNPAPLPNQLVTADQPCILTIPALPKYLYLSIDEFNKGVQNSFVTPLSNAFINKNVIARVSVDQSTFSYGSVLIANLHNGLLVSDVRNYNGKVDLQRFNIQLFNETGMPIDLNGQDFSFCIETTYE